MNFTEAVKQYQYGKKGQSRLYTALYYLEMLPAIRHAKVSAIPGGYFFVGQNYLFL